MMLRNRSPVTAPTAAPTVSNPKSSSLNANTAAAYAAGISAANANNVDDRQSGSAGAAGGSKTGGGNCELSSTGATSNAANSSTATTNLVTSPQHKPTHRRGFSHGSYSSMSASAAAAAAAAGSPNILLVNSPLGYVGTLGRAGMGNNSLEVQLNQHHANHYSANYLNHLSGNKEYGGSPLSAEQQMMMKTAAAASSNEALSSDDNVAPLHAVSANASHIAANYATGGSSSGTHSHHHHHNSSSSNNTPSEETKRAIAQYEQKIRRTKELIKEEQMRCNENVNEYLKLSANAELSQGQRIKSVFEKNNQKSAQRISKYQKKLKRYDQCIKDIKERGIYYRHTRERLRDLGTNVKEGISGLSGGVIEGIKSGIHTAGE